MISDSVGAVGEKSALPVDATSRRSHFDLDGYTSARARLVGPPFLPNRLHTRQRRLPFGSAGSRDPRNTSVSRSVSVDSTGRLLWQRI